MRTTIALTALLAASSALADPPVLLGYQGRLLKADGSPEVGTVTMGFAIFDSEASSSALWSETQTILPTNGFYSTLLGQASTLPSTVYDRAGSERWLEISVNGSALSPRQRIGSVLYALLSARAVDAVNVVGGSVTASSVTVGGKTVVNSSGNVNPASIPVGNGLAASGTDVSLMSCAANQVLKWIGGAWTCAADAGEGAGCAGGYSHSQILSDTSCPVGGCCPPIARVVQCWNGSLFIITGPASCPTPVDCCGGG